MQAAYASSTGLGQIEYITNDYAGVVWASAPGDHVQILVDLGRDRPVDTVMLFGLWGNIPASTQAFIALATSAQGLFTADYYNAPDSPAPFAGAQPIAEGNGVMFWRSADPARPSLSRYVSILFTNMGASGFVRIGRLVAGQAIELERNFSFGATFGVRDLGNLDFNRRGVLQRTLGKKLRTVGLTFSNVRKDEVEAVTKPLLERVGNTELVALVTDTAPHTQRQNRCYCGSLVGDLAQTWRKADLFEAKVNLVSVF